MFELKSIIKNNNFKQGVLYTLFSFINNGIAFVLVLILARYLLPSEYGQLNLFSTMVSLLTLLVPLSTASFVAVSFFNRDRQSLNQIVSVVAIVSGLISLFFIGIVYLFPSFFQGIVGIHLEYIIMGISISFFSVFNNLNLDIWRIEEQPIAYGLYSLSFAFCNFAISFFLIVVEKMGWEGRVYAWFTLSVLYFFISSIFLFRRGYFRFILPSKAILIETLLFSLPLIPHSITFWIKQGLDRYIIKFFFDTSAVGYYSFALNLATIISIIGVAFNATNSVYLFKTLSNGYLQSKEKLKKISVMMVLIFSIVTILIIFFSFGLIELLLPKYTHSMNFIIPLCLSGYFQCLYYIWVNYIVFYKKTYILMIITVGTSFLQFLLSMWLTRYSPVFTAWICCGVSLFTIILIYWQSKIIVKRHNI